MSRNNIKFDPKKLNLLSDYYYNNPDQDELVDALNRVEDKFYRDLIIMYIACGSNISTLAEELEISRNTTTKLLNEARENVIKKYILITL